MTYFNILSTWSERSDYDLSVGCGWYPHARQQCEALAAEFNVDLTRVVYATAAMSPLLKWERNIAATRNLLLGRKPGAVFGKNVVKAKACLAGDLTALSGQKVTNFAANILGDPDAVTVDTWAWRLWAGVRDGAVTLTDKLYSNIADDYRIVAAAVGYEPRQVQAVTWTTIRRMVTGKAYPGQLTLL